MTYPQLEVEEATARVGFQPQAPLPEVKRRVEKILRERRLTLHWLQDRVGITKTGYREMWQRESVRLLVIQKMAEVLGINLTTLLSADAPEHIPGVSEPAPGYHPKPRYLEQRVDDLERELASLKEHLKRK